MAITTTSGSLRANGLKLHRAISILDLETTGTFVEFDRIVEIGILKVQPDGTKRRFSQRVNPDTKSDDFRNLVGDTIFRTLELHGLLKKELRSHKKMWERRFDHYRQIHAN